MKTTTMNSLASVVPTFADREPRTAYSSPGRRRLGAVTWYLAWAGVVAAGFVVLRQTPAIAREIAAAKSSFRIALHDASHGYSGYGALTIYGAGQVSASQWQQPFPPSSAWEQGGARQF